MAKVRIINEKGHCRFNRLVDSGRAVLPFDSGGGFVERASLRAGERVVPGWLTPEEMDAQRDQGYGARLRGGE